MTPARLIPIGLISIMVALAALLVTISIRSPYTHINLESRIDRGYDRTVAIEVGPPVPLARLGPPSRLLPDDPVARGRALFVDAQCAACHGLEGRGGAVGTAIIGTKAETLLKKSLKGPGGMPAIAREALSDADYQAIAKYLKSLVKT